MTIWWVYFEMRGGHELKLQVEAVDKDGAEVLATKNASQYDLRWKFVKAMPCR